LILPAYTLCFALLHKAAGLWAGTAFFSLCYPAAGLRLAVLWRHGARLAPWLMAAELITDSLTGVFHAHGTDLAWDVTGVLRPGLAYGLTVAVVRRIALRHPRMLAMQPMELGQAAVLAPLANALLLVPMISNGHVPGTMPIHVNPIVALTSLVVGDMLGILMLSPPLLWLLGHLWRRPCACRSAGLAPLPGRWRNAVGGTVSDAVAVARRAGRAGGADAAVWRAARAAPRTPGSMVRHSGAGGGISAGLVAAPA
jgi:hypothetical protein